MHKFFVTLAMLLLASFVSVSRADDDEEAKRQAYLAKRAAEKAAAEEAVKELATRDQGTMAPDDWIRLSLAYNELSDNPKALEAICHVAESVLAEKKQLDLKAICFHNVNFGLEKPAQLRELTFIDRCLDKKYGNQGVWLWRKAKLICQASVAPAIPTRGDEIGNEAHVTDGEQYEYAFELLERAFATEPKLYHMAGVGHDFMWEQDFPIMSTEKRFQDLMKKHSVK